MSRIFVIKKLKKDKKKIFLFLVIFAIIISIIGKSGDVHGEKRASFN